MCNCNANIYFNEISSSICGNKMPTRCNRWFLLQILLLAQYVSGTIMPIIRSLRVLYRWLLPVVFDALVFKLSVWCCIVPRYCCCVVDRHYFFFFLQDFSMHPMLVISLFHHVESSPFCNRYYLFTFSFLSKQTRHGRNIVSYFFLFISGRSKRLSREQYVGWRM